MFIGNCIYTHCWLCAWVHIPIDTATDVKMFCTVFVCFKRFLFLFFLGGALMSTFNDSTRFDDLHYIHALNDHIESAFNATNRKTNVKSHSLHGLVQI